MSGKEYLSLQEGQFVVKRVLQKHGNTPVSFFDLLRNGDDLDVAIGTRSGKEYRGKGYAKKVTSKGMEWAEKNRDKWDNINWVAKKDNYKSIELAKKLNFKLDEGKSNNEWSYYIYK